MQKFHPIIQSVFGWEHVFLALDEVVDIDKTLSSF